MGRPTLTLFIENYLDKTLYVQVIGTMHPSIAKASSRYVLIGSEYSVAAGDHEAISLVPDRDGWLPFVSVELWCTEAPTTGYVNVWALYLYDWDVRDLAIVCRSLEIRDTEKHTPLTDNNIRWVRW